MLSIVYAIGSMLLGVAYLYPDEFVRNPDPTKRTAPSSTVAFIESLTRVPIWGVLFVIVAVMLFACLLFKRARDFFPYAHLASTVVLTMYTIASYTTAVINPGTYVTQALFVGMLAFGALVLMINYASRPASLDFANRE